MNKSFIFAALFLFSCARPAPDTDAMGHPIRKAGMVATTSQNIGSLTVLGDNTFIFLSDGTKITKISKGKTEDILSGMENPSAITYDDRRAQIYIAENSKIKIVKGKEPKIEIATIPLSEGMNVKDMVYSVMNRKTYATVKENASILEIDPVKKKFKVLIQSEVIEKLNVGIPHILFASLDGVRLYVLTKSETSSSVVKVNLKDKEAKVFQTFEGAQAVGIDMIKNHLVIAFAAAPYLQGYDFSRKRWFTFEIPEGLLHEPISMKMDRVFAMILDKNADSAALMQAPLKFQD